MRQLDLFLHSNSLLIWAYTTFNSKGYYLITQEQKEMRALPWHYGLKAKVEYVLHYLKEKGPNCPKSHYIMGLGLFVSGSIYELCFDAKQLSVLTCPVPLDYGWKCRWQHLPVK